MEKRYPFDRGFLWIALSALWITGPRRIITYWRVFRESLRNARGWGCLRLISIPSRGISKTLIHFMQRRQGWCRGHLVRVHILIHRLVEISGPVTELNKVNSKQFRLTLYTQLKSALNWYCSCIVILPSQGPYDSYLEYIRSLPLTPDPEVTSVRSWNRKRSQIHLVALYKRCTEKSLENTRYWRSWRI